jgi:hypothetical protein
VNPVYQNLNKCNLFRIPKSGRVVFDVQPHELRLNNFQLLLKRSKSFRVVSVLPYLKVQEKPDCLRPVVLHITHFVNRKKDVVHVFAKTRVGAVSAAKHIAQVPLSQCLVKTVYQVKPLFTNLLLAGELVKVILVDFDVIRLFVNQS